MISIEDADWLQRFQDRQLDVRPGDSIRAEMEVTVAYDYNNEVVSTTRVVKRVDEVIRPESPSQLHLIPPDGDDDD